VITALITPFSDVGDLDPAAHAYNLALQWDRGVRGFLIAGSTGEGPYLEPGERRILVETARRALPEAYLVAGVAAESLRLARLQAAEAGDGGADALLVLSPTSLARGDTDAMARFFADLAEVTPRPLLLYSVPKYAADEIPVEVAAGAAGLPGILGMKDSGGDPRRIAALAAATPPAFLLFTGSSTALATSIQAGAYGAITASGNYAPGLVGRAVGAGSGDAATEALASLAAAVEAYGIPGIKAAAEATGLVAGPPRRPLVPLDGEARARITAALAAHSP
jgi:4-hydroxy-2-oxoglutarate aldolase